jgi:hypothetical protein
MTGDVEPPPWDDVAQALFGDIQWIGFSESDAVERGRKAHAAGNELANLIAEGRGIKADYGQLAIGKTFQDPLDAAENAIQTIGRWEEACHHVGDTYEREGPEIQAAKEEEYKDYVDTKTQWDALQEAKQSMWNEEYWFDDTTLAEFAEPAKQSIAKNRQTRSNSMSARRAQAEKSAPAPPAVTDSIPNTDTSTRTVHTAEIQTYTSSPTKSVYSFSPASGEHEFSSGSTPDLSDGSASAGGVPMQDAAPAGPVTPTAATPQTGPAAASTDRPSASTNAMSATTPAAASGLPDAKGLAGEPVVRPSVGLGSGGIAGVPVANTATAPPVPPQPPAAPTGRVSVTGPGAPAAPAAPQSVAASGGGGSLARPGVGAGAGAPSPQPSAARVTAGPASAPEPLRTESAAAIAQRTGKPYELASDGVLRAEMHPYLQAAYGVVRLAAAQSRNYVMELDGDVSAAREVGEVDWSCGVFESPDSPVPVFVLASDLFTSLVPPTNKWDPGVVNPCAEEARVRKDTWVASCSDPTAAVIEYHGVMQADRRDDLLRLTYLVTTRTAKPGETVRKQLRLRETEYVVYKPDPGELAQVEVNAEFLRHRITLLDSSLAYVAGIEKLPRKKALGLGVALAREAIEQTKGWEEENRSLLTGILDTLQRGEEPEEDEWVEAQLLAANRIGEARKNSVTDRPLPVLNLKEFGAGSIDPAHDYIRPFLEAMAAQTVSHLRRLFDLWEETVGEVLADIVYDTHAATGELQLVREIVDEHLAGYREEKIPA